MKYFFRDFNLPSLLLAPMVLGLLITGGCTSGSNSTKATASSFQFPSLKNPWGKSDPKYAQLANGPLSTDIASELSPAAKKQALEAEYNALESRKSGESVQWQYSGTQNGKITPFAPYQVGASNCRRYVHEVSNNGQIRQSAGTACRDKEGKWTPLT